MPSITQSAPSPRCGFDLSYVPRMWRCDVCGRSLGVILRTTSRVRRLYVFIQSWEAEAVFTWTGVLPRGEFRVPGLDAGDVECSHCGNIQPWSMSEDAMRKLQSSLRQMRNSGGG